MSNEEIQAENKMLYDAMETLLHLIQLYSAMKKDVSLFKLELETIKRTINLNLHSLVY